jgi:hypothetical protein
MLACSTCRKKPCECRQGNGSWDTKGLNPAEANATNKQYEKMQEELRKLQGAS